MVNEAAVETFGWQKAENALGKGDDKICDRVVKDFNFESLHKPVDALLIGYARDGNGNGVSLKIDAAHIHEAINQLTKTWKNIVPEVPLQHSFVDERIAEQYGNEQKRKAFFMASQDYRCSLPVLVYLVCPLLLGSAK